MKQFYLRYEIEDDENKSLRISVCTSPIHDIAHISKNKFDFQNRIYVEAEDSRTVLNSLMNKIKADTGLAPNFEDALSDDPRDDIKEFASFRRHVTFLPQEIWERRGQSRKKAESEARDYNESLHPKLFPIYQQFVKEHLPYSESER